ncbi:DUF4199 domain-containing protein [uncultured Flavobacterium sp.]|uniref:DUF4199 domain-containing protein n=1 Tax=uncultured Flavobacterium sp. TaxID=165435 RepID=UPI0025CC763C|nr:DUF4199 domain-containing protein [uncultured Flavobacterium sp.]
MKKIVLTYGLLGGGISVIGYLITMFTGAPHNEFAMLIGFASMLAAFSLIFVATVKYRKQHDGAINFGNAFLIGLYISLIASTIYVLVWLYYLYNVYPDFAPKYAAQYLEGLKAAGVPQEKVAAEAVKMNQFISDYKKPWYVIAMTYTEILPIGIIVSLISAAILRRRPKSDAYKIEITK